MPAVAASLVSPEMLENFKRDGFVKLSKAVDEELIENALLEINKEMGQATGSNDQFKAKTFAKEAAITDLFNQSVIPFVMELLLGAKFRGGKYKQDGGQLALRFPGDACVGKTAKSNDAHLNKIAKGWHIDGLASDFIKGLTDHYGKAHNFDCLVGVCLSETKCPSSGELCTWPGSHDKIGERERFAKSEVTSLSPLQRNSNSCRSRAFPSRHELRRRFEFRKLGPSYGRHR